MSSCDLMRDYKTELMQKNILQTEQGEVLELLGASPLLKTLISLGALLLTVSFLDTSLFEEAQGTGVDKSCSSQLMIIGFSAPSVLEPDTELLLTNEVVRNKVRVLCLFASFTLTHSITFILAPRSQVVKSS